MMPLLSIVAALSLLDSYVIVPLLALVGLSMIENGAEPYVLFPFTVNVDRTGVLLLTVMATFLLASVKFLLAV